MTDINKTTHMQLKKKRVKKNPYKLGFNWFFWVSFFVILIPVCYFIYLLWMASQETHTPILGDRIKHTIQFAIDEDQLRIIEKDVNELPGVENAKVNLIVETVRIDVNTDDTLKEDDLLKINQDIYGIVNEVLPVDKYFSQHDDYKQYDLEITSFTDIKSDECVIVTLNKNSPMDGYRNQVLSVPVSPETRQELIDLNKPVEDPVDDSPVEGDDGPLETDEEMSEEGEA
ncbi:MAG: hypothetical protein II704_01050 [Erysipelotrichaceae bacterium]|nr:hypothetical protein [Erysipelotrichaceae bacterium]